MNKEKKKEEIDVLKYMRENYKLDKAENCDRKLTVEEWTEYWLANYCVNLKPNTFVYYKSIVQQHIDRVLGKLLLSELTTDDVQLFINSLYHGVGTDKLSPKSIKNVHGVLHKSMSVAVKLNYVAINPVDNVVLPTIRKYEAKTLNKYQLSEFFEMIKDNEKELIFLVSIFTGMRQGELIGLTWDCINFYEGSIYLYRQLVRNKNTTEFEFTTLKNNRTRKIYPAEMIMERLKKLRELNKGNEFVFVCPSSGTHYSAAAIYKSFKRIMVKLGYPNIRFHDLRHTYAVLALQAGDDMKALQSNLGHFSSSFTLDVYGHYTEEMQKNSAVKMTAFIRENFPNFK